jgi:hypothetical protein
MRSRSIKAKRGFDQCGGRPPRGLIGLVVARRHDVNSNQLFRWRQLLPKAEAENGAMVGVAIAPEIGRPRGTDRDGVIEIVFGG